MKVLIVDDEVSICQLLGEFLRRSGYEVAIAHTGAEAALLGSVFDAAVIDLDLPDISGEDIARRMARENPKARLLISTGHEYTPPRGLNVMVLKKPYLPRELLNVLAQAD